MPNNAILVAIDGTQAESWLPLLKAARQGPRPALLAGRHRRQDGHRLRLRLASAARLLGTLPNLKAILNLGAGVDALLTDPTLPDLPLARAAHPDLTKRVVSYVVLHVLAHHNRTWIYDAQQRERIWKEHKHPSADQVAVGMMGMGVIGGEAAQVLARLGFRVAGWSRTPKSVPGIEAFHGAAGLDAFLARTEILACLLPLTAQTEGLLNLSLFRKLKRDGAAGGAFLVNAARGRVQVDADIIAALDEGRSRPRRLMYSRKSRCRRRARCGRTRSENHATRCRRHFASGVRRSVVRAG